MIAERLQNVESYYSAEEWVCKDTNDAPVPEIN